MVITDFDKFRDNIFLINATKLVQHVIQNIMLRMNEHKIHDTVVSSLRYKMKRK